MNPLLGVSIIIAWISTILTARFLNMSWSLFLSGAVMSAFLGILAYVRIVLQISPKILDNIIDANRINRQTSWIERILDRENSKQPFGGCAPIFSRNIDKEINAIIDNALEDFEWLLYLLLKNEKKGSESSIEEVKHLVKRDLWFALSQLNARLSRVEKVRLLANDVVQKVTEHFAQIRLIASAQAMSVSSMVVDQDVSPCSGSTSGGGATSINYPVHSFLKDEESENLLLSKIADLLVLFLLPIQYTSCIATRPALCQVLAKKLFRPAVEYLTSPSAINQFILGWLQCDEADNAHDAAGSATSKDTTDDAFQLKMSLKQQRLNILADIVQATSKLDSQTDNIVNEADEDEMQMREQIAHLVRAKAECEDKLQALGMDCKQAADKQSEGELLSFSTVQCKNLSFATIMTSGPFTRRYFYQFLEHLEQQDLLGFWAAIEELKVADRTLWHQLGTEIFYTYINKPFSKVMRVERSVLKRIEDHLLGDSAGPDVFYELQAQVIQDLENKYYPAFLISDTCYKMLEEAHENNICIDAVVEQQEQLENNELKSVSSKAGGNDQDEFQYDCIATTHLDHIKEKLQNKSQALKALQGSLKSDSKVLKMLQGQVETLEERKIQVEQHLQRTEAWTEFLGLWRCHVQTVEYFEEEEVLKATLIVHVPVKDNIQEAAENPHPAASWICTKNVQDFQLLHKELLPYCSWLKGWLPSSLGGSISSSSPGNSLINFATRSSSSNLSSVFPAAVKTEKTRNVLQRYMDALLSDERLNQSENVFHFLCPSPAFLKKNNENHRKVHDNLQDEEEEGKLFPKIFKNTSSRAAKEKRLLFLDSSRLMKPRLSEEDHDVLADLDSRDAGGHGASSSTANSGGGGDGVAEPFYGLISEVFDMRGVSKILRKSLMTFVQLTYGRTITSYITSYIAWMTSDRMIIKYIKSLRQSLWPSSSAAVDSDLSEQEKAKDRAKEALIHHIPDWLAQLVGTQSSKNGVAKVFDTLQEKTLNKMLLYDLVEIVMYNLFPEVLLSEVAHSKG